MWVTKANFLILPKLKSDYVFAYISKNLNKNLIIVFNRVKSFQEKWVSKIQRMSKSMLMFVRIPWSHKTPTIRKDAENIWFRKWNHKMLLIHYQNKIPEQWVT